MEDVGSMSIQDSFKCLRSDEIFPIHLTIPMFSPCTHNFLKKISRGKHSKLFWWSGVSKFLEILDSIFRSQRFSVRKTFVHWCVTYMSVVQCWSTFSSFKLCKIQPVIGALLFFEPRSWPVKEWWNYKRNPTGCCPLVCGFSSVCATQWSSKWEIWETLDINEIVLVITHWWTIILQ